MDAEEISKLTGSDYPYDYHELSDQCSDQQLTSYCYETRRLFAGVAKNFSNEANTVWLVRSYLALKYILASTVLATSAKYADCKNIQITLPYLRYYTILNCCRAFLFTLPCFEWRGKTSIEMTHNNILNTTADKLRRLDENAESRWRPRLWAAKEQRDLFSYRFPASGLRVFGDNLVSTDEAIRTARLLTELAQVNSACLVSAIRKHKPEPFDLQETQDTWQMIQYELKDSDLIDDDDYHRVGYFFRKYKSPVALTTLATEGLVEDFFGAWSSDLESDVYDPDHDWRLLLDVS